MKENKYAVDMCSGALLPKIVRFCIPLVLSNCLQLAFNAADVAVVGKYAGDEALAAVGSTSALINLIINLFIGLSVGANVIMAHDWGAKIGRDIHETVHTAVTLSLISGTALIAVGWLLARPLLVAMGSPADVLDLSALYLRIYFIGMPVIMLYNFGSALLRAIGDTKRPLYFLTLAGCINVPLNLLFVIKFHIGVAGVALATVIAQVVSALLVLRCLMTLEGPGRLELRQLRLHRGKLMRMMQIGLPAGVQSMMFSFSNVLIQSSVNSFGSVVMAGNAAAASIEGFVYSSMNAVHQATVSFTSQHMGAGRTERIDRIGVQCAGLCTLIGLVMGFAAYHFGPQLLLIYTDQPAVVEAGMSRLSITCTLYFLCGLMEVTMGLMRGMGFALVPLAVSISGACVLRIIWILTIFRWDHTLGVLYASYPVSWAVTASVHLICYLVVRRRVHKRFYRVPDTAA